ncbi:hypothetical protein OAL14_00510 [Gammaproteobacteria bacterium]|nr:hypothetical protein [Gammaproteobacteria bacterium]
MKSVSVVVNARLGSSRVQNKLLRDFAGTSLLEIALKKLDCLDFFEHRFLGVAEQELKDKADSLNNVEILDRDMASVKPGVNPQSVTFAHYLRVPSDYVFVLNPCQPMLTTKTIKNAFDYFQNSSFISYTAGHQTRDWVFDNEGKALTNTNPDNLTTNKGAFFYKACHSFHIINKEILRETGNHWVFEKNDPHLIEIPEEEAIDVDTPLDFSFAEYVYKQKTWD